MKKYVEPKMESISFFISDVIAVSKTAAYGTEMGDEFEHNTDNGDEETFLNDMTNENDIGDGDW